MRLRGEVVRVAAALVGGHYRWIVGDKARPPILFVHQLLNLVVAGSFSATHSVGNRGERLILDLHESVGRLQMLAPLLGGPGRNPNCTRSAELTTVTPSDRTRSTVPASTSET